MKCAFISLNTVSNGVSFKFFCNWGVSSVTSLLSNAGSGGFWDLRCGGIEGFVRYLSRARLCCGPRRWHFRYHCLLCGQWYDVQLLHTACVEDWCLVERFLVYRSLDELAHQMHSLSPPPMCTDSVTVVNDILKFVPMLFWITISLKSESPLHENTPRISRIWSTPSSCRKKVPYFWENQVDFWLQTNEFVSDYCGCKD